MLLKDRDVVGQAQTGTGKTAAFMLPILQRIDPEMRDVQALVLCPTRELALQVADHARKFAVAPRRRRGRAGLRRRADPRADRPTARGGQVVVGTPGRVLDLLTRGKLILADARMVVLDEADEMLSMGFIDDVRAILRRAPWGRQTALFSATMPPEIRKLAAEELHSPETVSVTPEDITVERIEQRMARGRAARQARRHRQAPQVRVAALRDHLRAHQDRLPASRRRPVGARPPRPCAARRHGPGRPRLGHDRVPRRPRGDPRRHRRRLARPRRLAGQPRHQLRPARRARGVRPPHRPHRARRPRGQGHLAGHQARAAEARRDPEAARHPDPEVDRARRRGRRRAAGPTPQRATETETAGATVVATVPAGDATGDGEVRRKRRGRRGGRGRRPGGAAATASAE